MLQLMGFAGAQSGWACCLWRANCL